MITLEEAIKIAETERKRLTKIVADVDAVRDCGDRWLMYFAQDRGLMGGLSFFVFKETGKIEFFEHTTKQFKIIRKGKYVDIKEYVEKKGPGAKILDWRLLEKFEKYLTYDDELQWSGLREDAPEEAQEAYKKFLKTKYWGKKGLLETARLLEKFEKYLIYDNKCHWSGLREDAPEEAQEAYKKYLEIKTGVKRE